MYEVSRRFIQTSKNSPGRYEFSVIEYGRGSEHGREVDDWMSETEYREWKQTIIKEDFPHCE